MTESNNVEKELNPQILRKLEWRIFSLERENNKTKRLSDSDMVQKIRKNIDEIVRSEDNI